MIEYSILSTYSRIVTQFLFFSHFFFFFCNSFRLSLSQSLSLSLSILYFTPCFPQYDVDDPTGPDDDVLNALVTLGSFEQASLQLFQIAMTNNWQDIMYANVLSPYDVSNVHRVAMAAFFVSFFFCMVSPCVCPVHCMNTQKLNTAEFRKRFSKE